MNAMQSIASIGRLQQTLNTLARVPRRIAVLAAPQIQERLLDEFRSGANPYGRPWAPLRPSTLRKHGPPPLTDTGALKHGTRAFVMRGNRAGIHIVLGERYGFFHQVGFRTRGRRVPPRRILPQFGIPRTWRAVLDSCAKQAAQEGKR
jgi:hypothetical protein